MAHDAVPPEIQKTLVGWKKYFNSYTKSGRFNTVILSLGLATAATLYFTSGKGNKQKDELINKAKQIKDTATK